jgi:hypothetical protein
MFHRDVFVGLQAACLATCLLGTGCGDNKPEVPAEEARIPELAALQASVPPHDARPIDPSPPAAADRDGVVPVHYLAPLAPKDPVAPKDSVEAAEKVDRQQLHRAIELAAGYLIRACGDDGQMEYRINLDPAVKSAPQYNLLRHAGAIYALGMYHTWRADPSAEAAMLRAIGFLKNQAIRGVEGREDLLAVWSRPELDSAVDTVEAKLGGAGLGLVALTSVERFRPGTTPLDELRGLGRFILYLQKPDGSFVSKYTPSQGGFNDAWTSLYYPGEAALGLLTLYELDPQPQWREGAERALEYLARYRRDSLTVEPDHWALLTTAKLFELAQREGWEIDRPGLTYHAAQICQRMVDDMPLYAAHGAMAGCLTVDGRTCSTAGRLEGLQAALPWLPPDHAELHRQMLPAIDAAIAFLVRAQVPSGPHAGGIPWSVVLLASQKERCGEVRIDYVQHALSAMLQYDSLRFNAN